MTDTTKNNNVTPPCSGNTAGASRTNYRLSLDAAISSQDPLLTGSRSVPSLTGGSTYTGTVTVKIPTSLAVGIYYLGACADGGNSIIEGSELDNCTASVTTIQVR